MRYINQEINLPAEKRRSYNEQVIAIIQKGQAASLNPEEVFNTFSGKGGTHDLSFSDFSNYYEYSKAKKQVELGQFFTPHQLCQQITNALRPRPGYLVADLACGSGNFFNYLPNDCKVYGNELDSDAFTVCRFLYPDVELTQGDFTQYAPQVRFDLVTGNPPFNLDTDDGTSQYAYIRKAESLLQYGGLLAIIVPQAFLSDTLQDNRKIKWINEHFNFVLQAALPDDSFQAAISTKLLVLQKKGVTNSGITFDPERYIPFIPETIYTHYIAPIQEQNQTDRPKLHLLTVRNNIDNAGTAYQISKWLFQIKASPRLRRQYRPALRMVEKLSTQEQPEGMDNRKWDRIKLTPEKVLSHLKRLVRRQNAPKPVRVLKVVKTNYGIKLKAYHPVLAKHQWYQPFYELATGKPPKREAFEKLLARKQRQYQNQSLLFEAMERNPALDSYLDKMCLTPAIPEGQLFPLEGATIQLNDIQKQDLGLAFQKRYAQLAWEQGGGKSVAGMSWINLHQDKCRNIFVLAPALAIQTTWTERLTIYGFDFMRVSTITEARNIPTGKIVIISFEALSKLARFIKAHVKRCSYKIGLLVDESDELTNPQSERTRATLACFRKAKYKLLTTGTTTRNNISELYPQLELLYNNSYNMLCMAQTCYYTTKESDIEKYENPDYNQPFGARGGNSLFRACFCPQRTTVFGIQKQEQDVYNAGQLAGLIAKTIICRKFQDIVGEKKYTIHGHQVAMNQAEQKLYELLLTKFLTVVYDFYTTTGNQRKESAMRLARQIRLLITASSVPHLMAHYEGVGLPSKYFYIRDLIDSWPTERVAVGTILKSAARSYFEQLQKSFPERRILYIDGEVSIGRRKKILRDFEAAPASILVCTQQSLKSSVNIPFCNRCIIEALQWNIPKMSQFYFRFIRFDSTRHTQVHFVTYQETIETNMLALLMAKERLNEFVKTRSSTGFKQLYDDFDLDESLLDSLIQKEYDKDGKLYLRWGSQTFQRA